MGVRFAHDDRSSYVGDFPPLTPWQPAPFPPLTPWHPTPMPQPYVQPPIIINPITEDDIRRIVREELDREQKANENQGS